MAHSPYTQMATGYVALNPGCSKLALAGFLRNDNRLNPTRLYYLVNTQIRLGNIIATAGKGNAYALYLPGQQERMANKV